MKNGVKVTTYKTAHTSNDLRHRIKAKNVKVLQRNIWIDDRKFLKSCVQARAEQGNINHPVYGTWTADFIYGKNEGRAF